MNAYKEIQNALLEIKGGNYSKDWGICLNVYWFLSEAWEVFVLWKSTSEGAFRDWPKFSGCPTFPVPYGHSHSCAEEAFYSLDKWSKDSQYGRDRWELLEHLIEWYGKKADETSEAYEIQPPC